MKTAAPVMASWLPVLLLVGCASKIAPSAGPSARPLVSAAPTDAGTPVTASQPSATIAPTGKGGALTAVLGGLIEFELPERATLQNSGAGEGVVYLSPSCPGTEFCVSAFIERGQGHSPGTLEDAVPSWNEASRSAGYDHGSPGTSLGDGVTPAGGFYGIRTFKVRVGFPGLKGQTIHTYQAISRVYSVLRLDDDRYVRCTGYLPYEVKTLENENLQRVLRVCTSIRRRK